MPDQQIDYEQAEALGISHEAYDQVLDIVGHIPSVDELSTLLAMWESNGRQQSLYGWLRGQHHTVQRNDYLYTGSADHRSIREPKVKECLAIATHLCTHTPLSLPPSPLDTGQLLYMVGNISSEFADSEYARQCLHMVEQPMSTGQNDEERQYIELILNALQQHSTLHIHTPVAAGGLFCSLLSLTVPRGYDILTPREVRLDAFLFGEEPGRYLVALPEKEDDLFLLKLTEARLNCCFLGRTTKGRILVDGYDFGPVSNFLPGHQASNA